MQFSKMQGVGNDFVVLNADALPLETNWAEVAIRLCMRRGGHGVGADGLLTVSRRADGGAAFTMRMFNPDGTEDMCGNGLRCAGLWAHRAGWLGDEAEFVIATKEGPKRARLGRLDTGGRSATLSVDMGLPHLTPAEIPFCAGDEERVVGFPLTVEGVTLPITALNTGSAHTVLFGTPPDEATFQRLSPLIENHALFPERTTVLWATPEDEDTFRVRIWERGVGETFGCGTGACAVGVAARLNGLTSGDDYIKVVSKGGVLGIRWPGGAASVEMVGPASFVFEGEI